jgi:hypothetical protein
VNFVTFTGVKISPNGVTVMIVTLVVGRSAPALDNRKKALATTTAILHGIMVSQALCTQNNL